MRESKARMVNGQSAGIDPDQYPQNGQGHCPLLWARPAGQAWATLILAHGAGAAMDSPFLQRMAELLAAQGLALVRFEFPYMAQRRSGAARRPPDRQPLLLDCWRQMHALLRPQVAGPLVIAGKSMGGRMASLLADELGADALVCLGYPFHPPGKPQQLRTAHLAGLRTPALIVQGERDPFGGREEVSGYDLSPCIQLHWLAAADHDFVPLKRSGLTQEEHLQDAAVAIASWLRQTLVVRGAGR